MSDSTVLEMPKAAPTPSTDLPLSLDAYQMQDVDEVHAFVAGHPHLQPLLEEAPKCIHVFFPNAPLSLKVVHDPEEPGHPQLVVFAYVTLDGRVAFDTLKKLDAAWWLERSRQARGDMEITLEWL